MLINCYGQIITDIIESSKENKNQFHPYIYDTFNCFRHDKKHIEVNIWGLGINVKTKGLFSLITPDFEKVNQYLPDISFWIDKDNKQNMINPDLFELFPNLNTISINALDYPFSLLSFLSLIRDTSIEKVKIWTGSENIPKLLSSDPRYIEIKEKYNQEQYQITEEQYEIIINKY